MKYVFWDLDGTLMDSKPGLFWAFEKMFEKLGRAVPPRVQ